jgi:DNA-binding transcriptional ArsR family regulator
VCSKELVERTGLSQPNVSKHLACLWDCGLVARERRGREVFYRSIEGLEELLAAADMVLERAGETTGLPASLTDLTLYRGERRARPTHGHIVCSAPRGPWFTQQLLAKRDDELRGKTRSPLL